MVGAHVGICDPSVTRTETNERKMRSATGERSPEGVVVVESYDGRSLADAAAGIEALVAGAGLGFRPVFRQSYTLAYMLRE